MSVVEDIVSIPFRPVKVLFCRAHALTPFHQNIPHTIYSSAKTTSRARATSSLPSASLTTIGSSRISAPSAVASRSLRGLYPQERQKICPTRSTCWATSPTASTTRLPMTRARSTGFGNLRTSLCSARSARCARPKAIFSCVPAPGLIRSCLEACSTRSQLPRKTGRLASRSSTRVTGART